MGDSGRIIVGVDPHVTSMAAVELGARLAAGLGTTLELFTPVYNSHISLAHFENRESLQHARDLLVRRYLERLEQVGAKLGFNGPLECHASWDHPLEEALTRRVLERAASLLIVSLPAMAGSGGRPLSSAQWQLVRHCPAPVLLTRGRTWGAAPVMSRLSIRPGAMAVVMSLTSGSSGSRSDLRVASAERYTPATPGSGACVQ